MYISPIIVMFWCTLLSSNDQQEMKYLVDMEGDCIGFCILHVL